MLSDPLPRTLSDQETIIALQKELELKNQCLSLIAHDFSGVSRNLLWVIESLKDGSIDLDIFQTLYSELKAAAETNQKLISNTISWINSQQSEFQTFPEKIQLSDFFRLLKENLDAELIRKNINLIYRGNEQIAVFSDRVLLHFILKSLVENAIKYSGIQGTVYFEAEEAQDKSVTIIIKDEGMGMNETVLADLFTFKSSPYTGTTGEKGAGLSLIVVRDLARLQGIRLAVHSAEGSGTTIELTIPFNENLA